MTARYRVAYLTYHGKPHVGGQGIYTRHLTKALTELGHEVEVFGGQPYPELDDRVTLHRLPSLDLFNDLYPGRFPAYWELKSREDLLEIMQFSAGTFSEPLAFSFRALRALTPRHSDFDVVHDNQCLGYGILLLERTIPTLVTLHHPITRDRMLEMERAPTQRKRRSVGRWYSFVKMQAAHTRMPRIVVVAEESISDIHSDMGIIAIACASCRLASMPRCSVRSPGRRRPGRLITTSSADVALKGLGYLIEAVAKLRTEHDVSLTIIGRPRSGQSMDLINAHGLADCVQFVSGVSDERIVELYAESELAVVPSLYEGFSLPAIEAMATGTALVATDGGALPEVTGRDGETVLPVPCRRRRGARHDDPAPDSATPNSAPASATPAGVASPSAGRGGAAQS